MRKKLKGNILLSSKLEGRKCWNLLPSKGWIKHVKIKSSIKLSYYMIYNILTSYVSTNIYKLKIICGLSPKIVLVEISSNWSNKISHFHNISSKDLVFKSLMHLLLHILGLLLSVISNLPPYLSISMGMLSWEILGLLIL